MTIERMRAKTNAIANAASNSFTWQNTTTPGQFQAGDNISPNTTIVTTPILQYLDAGTHSTINIAYDLVTANGASSTINGYEMTVIWGSPLLRVLRHFRIGKLIRVDEPGHHNVKMGTPTMGGVLFILPVLMLTGLLNAATLIGFTVTGRSVLVPLIVLVG